ncbi:helix-turn-helix transcriptional regulator [Viridibacillus sp. YIM B01967]|uniref:Helix-turn-helix transcriptional regulator n=1 Tax=Viridibacillus soli TaxID=2798301 RepID=A0ABS1H626_9BACL|nr:XRE family transcriptional regulator [Viridibacillus soli]MBK3494873.1 helix-turn-helix transcriptional regulator [Viridibacillus soli]
MEEISRNLGRQLKKIRQQRLLSFDDLAKLTDVSKGQLAQIEKGDSNPTVSTIWKIAAGLRISFSSLLQPPQGQYLKINSAKIPFVAENDGKYRVYSIIPYDPERGWELFKVEMDPGCSHSSEAHTEGVEETITAIKGQVIVEAGDMCETLDVGETLVFSGQQVHQYTNGADEVTVLHFILQYK